jgi:hypothetical protein
VAPQMPQERSKEVSNIEGLEVARLETEVEDSTPDMPHLGPRNRPAIQADSINLVTNSLTLVRSELDCTR